MKKSYKHVWNEVEYALAPKVSLWEKRSKLHKIIKEAVIVFSLMIVALTWSTGTVFADDAAKPVDIFLLPGSSQYGDIPAPVAGGTAQNQFAQLVWGIILNVRYILGSLAIAMIILSGFRMVIGGGKEDTYAKQRIGILYAIIGLALVGLAGEIANVFQVSCPESLPGQPTPPCTKGGFLGDPNSLLRTAVLFDQTTQIIITFIKYLIGSIAVLMIVRNGLRMITMGSSEEKMALDKKNLVYSMMGLVMIIIADTAISKVIYKVDMSKYPGTGGLQPAIDPVRGIQEIVGFTNFAVALIGPAAILALVAGGVMYITAGGQEDKTERAKRLIFASLAGIIIIFGAFAIVSTFVSGSFS